MMLDQIWFQEIDVLKPSDPNKASPIIVYINAHAKVNRIPSNVTGSRKCPGSLTRWPTGNSQARFAGWWIVPSDLLRGK